VQVPTHAQTSSSDRPDGQALAESKRRADLCRRDPALFARLVRRSDWYKAQGWPVDEALRQAMVDYAL
jgi:hypothetical protein